MAISLAVAGQAMATRITTGITVQTISALVLWVKVAATGWRERWKRNIATAIAPNTTTPMATHTHRLTMCASQARCAVRVTPRPMFICQGLGSATCADASGTIAIDASAAAPGAVRILSCFPINLSNT
ncbi:MAG: hypothetical protein QM805_16885 [Pseudomonas sp.]